TLRSYSRIGLQRPVIASRSPACERSQAMVTLISSVLRRTLQGGITPAAPLVILYSIIARSPLPQVQFESVRFGAPSTGLPSPVGPWQAEHSANCGSPAAAFAGSCGAPD